MLKHYLSFTFIPIGLTSAKTTGASVTVQEEFEDTNGIIRICKSKKNRQQNGQKKKYKQRSTKHKHKAKDRVTRTPLKTGMNSGARQFLYNN